MLKGIDIKQRIEFVSEKDTDEPKTVFVLRPLTSLEKLNFATASQENQSAGLEMYLRKSIVEVRNFHVSEIGEVIDSLPPETLGEIMIELNKINELSKNETKNS